jgi:hypothetical protein
MVGPKKAKATAAEQLLRMIEAPAGGPAPSTPRPPGWPLPDFHDQWTEWSWRLRRFFMPARLHGDTVLWNLQIASRALWAALALLGAYALVSLIIAPAPPRQRPALPALVLPGEPATAAIPAQRPLSQYFASIQERNPFTGLAASVAVAVRETKTAKQRLQEAAKDLVVVGINRGASPEALIEDAGQRRTVIVKPGDVLGEVKVRDINAQGVLLVYEGEELLIK